jgi:hypothetical protein
LSHCKSRNTTALRRIFGEGSLEDRGQIGACGTSVRQFGCKFLGYSLS